MYDMLSALLEQCYRRGEDRWGVVHELFDATQGPVKVRCVRYLLIGERDTDVVE